jgi:hypothetical protein
MDSYNKLLKLKNKYYEPSDIKNHYLLIKQSNNEINGGGNINSELKELLYSKFTENEINELKELHGSGKISDEQLKELYNSRFSTDDLNKINNLSGGWIWPFSIFFGSSTVPDKVETGNTNDDGNYLLFYLPAPQEGEIMKDQYYEYIQDEIHAGKKNGDVIVSKKFFKDTFNEKAYLLNKKGDNITLTIIVNDNNNNSDIINIIDEFKKSMNIEKDIEDPFNIKEIKEINCEPIKNNISQINMNIENFKKRLDTNKYNSILIKLNEIYNSNDKFINKIMDEYNDFYKDNKTKIIGDILEDESITKYQIKLLNFQTVFNSVTYALLNEKIKSIIKGFEFNMILKIKETDTDYIFDEIITDNTISYTTMYGQILKSHIEEEQQKKEAERQRMSTSVQTTQAASAPAPA